MLGYDGEDDWGKLPHPTPFRGTKPKPTKAWENLLARDRKMWHDNFLKSADWSFDPKHFGFTVSRRWLGGGAAHLAPAPRKFQWVAEKIIRWRRKKLWNSYRMTDVFTIVKNLKTGEYLVTRDRTEDKENSADDHGYRKTTKTVLAVIDSQLEAKGVLAPLGAFRAKRKT